MDVTLMNPLLRRGMASGIIFILFQSGEVKLLGNPYILPHLYLHARWAFVDAQRHTDTYEFKVNVGLSSVLT